MRTVVPDVLDRELAAVDTCVLTHESHAEVVWPLGEAIGKADPVVGDRAGQMPVVDAETDRPVAASGRPP